MKMVKGLHVSGSQEEAVKQIKQLYKLFVEKDCTMVEVTPAYYIKSWHLTSAGQSLGRERKR